MRYVIGILCVLALAVMGCSETTGTGGSGGDGGMGGVGGDGGNGGMFECQGPDDAGKPCGNGLGTCGLEGACARVPCTEQGVRDAIEAGGGLYDLDCEEGEVVVTEAEIVIDNDVILEGEGQFDGAGEHVVFSVPEGVTTELRGFTIAHGAPDGIQNRGTLTLERITLWGNVETGISNEGGQLTVVGSTILGAALFEPSGVYTRVGTLTVTNSTISGNAGYGIRSDQSETMITYTTITENGSWGIWNEGSDLVGHRPVTIAKSIVADDCEDGPITSGGYNIESTGDTCGFDQGTDQVNVSADDLKLGPLGNDFGPTETHALGEGSVAIDVIPAEDCVVETDQRGVPRADPLIGTGERCDVGANEWAPSGADGD